MKKFSKILSVALLVALVLSLGVASAFAADAGSITVTNAEVGAKYKLFKLFDATVAPDGAIAYSTTKTAAELEADTFFNQYFEVKNGNIFVKQGVTFDAAVLKSDDFADWAEDFGEQVLTEITADSATVEFSPVPYGYYYVTSNVGAVISVDSANPHADVIDKNQTVSFDKNIITLDDENKEKLVKGNEAGLNIDVPFDLTVGSKRYDGEDKIYKYVISDTMDPGFSIKEGATPVVKVGGTVLEEGADKGYTITYYKAKGGDVTTTLSEAQYFEITIPWTQDGTKDTDFRYDDPNAVINVRYTAILDPLKADKVSVGDIPNYNKAKVTFYKDNSEHPTGETPEKTTKTWETSVTIIKHDGSNNILTGAQFTLSSTNGTKVSYVYEAKYEEDADGTFYKLKDGTYTSEAPNSDPTHNSVYESTTTKYKLVKEANILEQTQNTSISAYVGADGTVTFSGLGQGDYKIEETVVPAGYNKAADIEFKIIFTISGDEEDPTGTFSTNNTVSLTAANNVFETTVINQKGTELPSTGGIGTTIFYVVGGVLVLAAIILLVTKKRMSD